MFTDLVQGRFYDVYKNDGTLLVRKIEYSGREEGEKFIFIVTLLEQNGEDLRIEFPLGKNDGYNFVLKTVQR